MTDFAHINLLEIDDGTPAEYDQVEGRFGRKHLDSRDIGVSHWRYAPGFKAKRGHKHREQEEAYVVVGGSGRVLLGDEVRDLAQWDVVRVSPQLARAFEAGPDGLELIAVGGPKPAEGDGEPVDVSWPDD
jgi:mannose-6-phosphate isomerase-like protein (cupin superfamily)